MIRFAARTTHPWSPPGWIWVIVHDTPEQLQASAARYSPGFDATETAACFQNNAFRIKADDDGRVTVPASRYAGVLRILPKHGIATLAHEVTHAAVAMYYRQHATRLDVESPMDDEEVLCYAVGDLVGTITTTLQAKGVWP